MVEKQNEEQKGTNATSGQLGMWYMGEKMAPVEGLSWK